MNNQRSCTDSKIQLPKLKLENKKSFHFSGPEIWNSIPIHIRKRKSLKSFKYKCFSYLLSSQWVYFLCFHYSANAECFDGYYVYVYIYVCFEILTVVSIFCAICLYTCMSHCLYSLKASGESTVYRENFAPVFIFALFALWPEGEFKTGFIQLYIKVYVRKLDSGRIQDWVNQS